LPLGVEVCTPVSETGRAGALPAAAANYQCADVPCCKIGFLP